MPLVVDRLELSWSRTELLLAKHNSTSTWLYEEWRAVASRRVACRDKMADLLFASLYSLVS
jgi:hypothetical protein